MVKTILIPLDTREESSWRRALPVALDLAQHHGATLHLVTVIEPVEINLPGVPAPEEMTRKRRDNAARKLEQIVGAQVPADFPHQLHAVAGNVHREILGTAERIGADLIVMASHRPALSTYLLGTHAARVVRHATCSVYVVRDDD